MPDPRTIERAEQDKKAGKSPSTQAGEFVKEEIGHVQRGKHGARSAKQAIAIGLSKARRAGVDLPPPKPGTTSAATRRKAERDIESGDAGRKPVTRKRSRTAADALKREPKHAASKRALSRQARAAARRRSASSRSASARRAARTRAATARSAMRGSARTHAHSGR
jgi:hypothetical protein